MGDKFTESYFMSLLDDAERIIASDPLGDTIPYLSYSIKEKEGSKAVARAQSALETLYHETASCHLCHGYERRSVFAEPIGKKGAKVLFIAPYPEGNMIFSEESLKMFRAWWKLSLLLDEGEWALTTLIKCPVGSFSRSAADACRPILRTEMTELKPEAMVLMGRDAASYMLNKDVPMEMLRGKRFVVNHIPVFVTYTPMDYILNPSLKKPIWNDMLFIRSMIGTEDRKV